MLGQRVRRVLAERAAQIHTALGQERLRHRRMPGDRLVVYGASHERRLVVVGEGLRPLVDAGEVAHVGVLAFGVEESIRQAQQGGLGVVAYNRKEGRALGEVVKLLVYNARRQSTAGDHPADYFTRTEAVAGVTDMRFQSLSVDVLHWLGLRRIDRWVSMSNLKSGALEDAGIRIVKQIEIPDALVPRRADVEITAKRAAGYFTQALAS